LIFTKIGCKGTTFFLYNQICGQKKKKNVYFFCIYEKKAVSLCPKITLL
jgi:hypothetical protein